LVGLSCGLICADEDVVTIDHKIHALEQAQTIGKGKTNLGVSVYDFDLRIFGQEVTNPTPSAVLFHHEVRVGFTTTSHLYECGDFVVMVHDEVELSRGAHEGSEHLFGVT
jgi:hypothetical protein